MSCWIAATAVERDASRIAAELPALWRDIRRFNLPVKLALAAAQRVLPAVEDAAHARLIALAPCRPGSPELRQISRELDAGFARGSCDRLRVNPIYTLHAIDNLALSALAIRLENRERCVCLGGAAGHVWDALEQALDTLATEAAREVIVFGGDQGEAAWQGTAGDDEGCGVAVVLSSRPSRVRLVGVERSDGFSDARPHATRGLAAWLAAVETAPPGRFAYRVPPGDGDGCDTISVVTEVA